MKKFASAAATAVLLGSGLVGVTATTAEAAPYPGSIETTAEAHRLNNPRVGHNVKVKFRVTVPGNGHPRGRVFFTYMRRGNHVVVDQFSRWYRGQDYTKYAFEGVPRGRYRVKVFFNSKPNDSVYKNDRTHFFQRVRPRR